MDLDSLTCSDETELIVGFFALTGRMVVETGGRLVKPQSAEKLEVGLTGCGKTRKVGPFPHRSVPFSGLGEGVRAAFAAGFPGLCRFEAESGYRHAAAINFGSLTRL
ncbi:hypothetical protein JCM17960_31850 [Magnetospira thiophila]